jgi:hypothetical protein
VTKKAKKKAKKTVVRQIRELLNAHSTSKMPIEPIRKAYEAIGCDTASKGEGHAPPSIN